MRRTCPGDGVIGGVERSCVVIEPFGERVAPPSIRPYALRRRQTLRVLLKTLDAEKLSANRRLW